MRILLIPLDERPVNTRYPQMIADIAGFDLVMPPPDLLSHIRQPAQVDALFEWLATHLADCDLAIVSVETLAYGGLIASRITDESTTRIVERIERLATQLDGEAAYGFSVITRIGNADYNLEEPAYWDTQGRNLYRYSQLKHRRQQGDAVQADIDTLQRTIPADALQDFTSRRLRNHIASLFLMDRFVHGLFDLLVISSDDTSEYGYGSQEKAWLRTWLSRFELPGSALSARLADSLLMYPGADEVGCVLLMRAVLQQRGWQPAFRIIYAIEADRERIAPYEDSPIAVTVTRQIEALGGRVTDDDQPADFVVAVNTPSRIGREFDAEPQHFASERAYRAPALQQFVGDIRQQLDAGQRLILCDVAYPNGSDPFLIEQLDQHIDLTQLAAYGAWNTAGNTIGTALAQGVAAALATTEAQQQAQQRFLVHRFVEDWGYQHLAREAVRHELADATGLADLPPDADDATVAEVTSRIEKRLAESLNRLGSFSNWTLTPGGVRLPWRRTFEVDFDLTAPDSTTGSASATTNSASGAKAGAGS